MKRFVCVLLLFAFLVGLFPGVVPEAAAARTYYVGESISIYNIIGECNCKYNSCYSTDISFSDDSMVGSAKKPIEDVHLMDEITFLKAGTLSIYDSRTGYDQNEVPARPHHHSRSKTITIVNPEEIKQNVRISVSNAFVGGGIFPEITVPAGANYSVTEATIYREMVNYYPGDKLPMYNAGTELLLELTIEPQNGYYFWYNESSSAASGKTNVKVAFNGKTYDPYVTHKKAGQKLYVNIPVTYESGANYAVTITGLDEPHHGGTLDYTASVNNNCSITSIRYLMYGKEVTEVKAGDRIGIAIRVKSGTGNVFVNGGKAYWNGRYSEPSTAITDYEVEFVFPYDVKAQDQQYIKQVDLYVDAPKFGAKPDTTVGSMTPYITTGAASWSPVHTTFKKGNIYTVKIPIEPAEGYLFPGDVGSIAAYLNDTKAAIIKEASGIGAKENLASKYYLTYTFPMLTADGAVNQPLKLYAVSEQDVVVKDSKTNVTLEVNVTGADDPTNVQYRWYPCDATGKDLQGSAIGSGQALNLGTIPQEKTMMQSFYHCVVSCGNEGDDMIFSVILAPDGAAGIGGEGSAVSFSLAPVSEQNIHVYNTQTAIKLEAKVVGAPAGKLADFQWYRCDKDGNSLEDLPRSMGSFMTLNGIAQDQMLVPQYYRCSAMIDNTYRELIFTVMLCPMGVENDDPAPVVKPDIEPMSFSDVPADQWYYKSVKAAYEMGLINGKGDGKYKPNDNMTVAEAVKLAACMNILYNGGDPTTAIKNGTDVWYSTYMKYALDNGIIAKDLSARGNEKITRREYVYIFSKALPQDAFAIKNDIPEGSIPDIRSMSTSEDIAIYLFYRAGILNGSDKAGTFNPNGNIVRSEVAAILIRMMDASYRVDAPAELKK